MKTIYADFNAGTTTERISITTLGSLKSLADNEAHEGDWVWLSDGEIRMVGRLLGEEAQVYSYTKEDVQEEPGAPTCKRCGKDDKMERFSWGHICRRCQPQSADYTTWRQDQRGPK